jgi:hypothetical protein
MLQYILKVGHNLLAASHLASRVMRTYDLSDVIYIT